MQFTAIALAAPVLAGCDACAHQPRPVTMAFGSVQCQQVREVMCVGTGAHCASLDRAVAQVNKAIGRTLLHFTGSVAAQRAEDAALAGVYIVAVGETPPGVLGMTPACASGSTA